MDFNVTTQSFSNPQSPMKHWAMLAYAWRISCGMAKPHESAFMTMLANADIPQTDEMNDADMALRFQTLCNIASSEYPDESLLEVLFKTLSEQKSKGGE